MAYGQEVSDAYGGLARFAGALHILSVLADKKIIVVCNQGEY